VVSVVHFAERLADRQAVDSARSRIDWKHLLGLELESEGLDFSVLSSFRTRMVEHSHEQVVLDRQLERLSGLGFLRAGGRVRTDATRVLAVVRDVNRRKFCAEPLRCALEAPAVAAPHWPRVSGLRMRPGRNAMDSARTPTGCRKATWSPQDAP
jgi:hypothetical protein